MEEETKVVTRTEIRTNSIIINVSKEKEIIIITEKISDYDIGQHINFNYFKVWKHII